MSAIIIEASVNNIIYVSLNRKFVSRTFRLLFLRQPVYTPESGREKIPIRIVNKIICCNNRKLNFEFASETLLEAVTLIKSANFTHD